MTAEISREDAIPNAVDEFEDSCGAAEDLDDDHVSVFSPVKTHVYVVPEIVITSSAALQGAPSVTDCDFDSSTFVDELPQLTRAKLSVVQPIRLKRDLVLSIVSSNSGKSMIFLTI